MHCLLRTLVVKTAFTGYFMLSLVLFIYIYIPFFFHQTKTQMQMVKTPVPKVGGGEPRQILGGPPRAWAGAAGATPAHHPQKTHSVKSFLLRYFNVRRGISSTITTYLPQTLSCLETFSFMRPEAGHTPLGFGGSSDDRAFCCHCNICLPQVSPQD